MTESVIIYYFKISSYFLIYLLTRKESHKTLIKNVPVHARRVILDKCEIYFITFHEHEPAELYNIFKFLMHRKLALILC